MLVEKAPHAVGQRKRSLGFVGHEMVLFLHIPVCGLWSVQVRLCDVQPEQACGSADHSLVKRIARAVGVGNPHHAVKKGGSRLRVKLPEQDEGLGLAGPRLWRIKKRVQFWHVRRVDAEMLVADALEGTKLGGLHDAVGQHHPEQHQDLGERNRILGNVCKRTREPRVPLKHLRNRRKDPVHHNSESGQSRPERM